MNKASMHLWGGAIVAWAGLTVAISRAASPEGAQEQALQYRHSGVAHSSLFGLSMERDRGIAVGTLGSILVTHDAGQSWEPQNSPNEDVALLDVAIAGKYAIAVGQLGKIIVREEAGWREISNDASGRLLTVDINASGQALIGGEFGAVLYSSDGGRSWMSVRPDWQSIADPALLATAEPHIYGVDVDSEGTFTVVGEFGAILQSTDSGKTWMARRAPKADAPTFFGLHQGNRSSATSFVVGQKGALMKSIDGGATWAPINANSGANLLGVSANDAGTVVVTAMRSMLISEDSGNSWVQVSNQDIESNWYLDVAHSGQGEKFYAVGHSSRIIEIGRK